MVANPSGVYSSTLQRYHPLGSSFHSTYICEFFLGGRPAETSNWIANWKPQVWTKLMWEMIGLKLRRNNMGERVLPWNSPLEIRKGGEFQASV